MLFRVQNYKKKLKKKRKRVKSWNLFHFSDIIKVNFFAFSGKKTTFAENIRLKT